MFIFSFIPVHIVHYLLLGRPNLNQRHRSLKTSCLQEHEEFLNEELEPLDICDLLFEERAMEISAHDKITETSKRQKQMKYLLETVNENENDCFYLFLYILQKEGYESILEELKKSTPGAVGAGMFNIFVERENILFLFNRALFIN